MKSLMNFWDFTRGRKLRMVTTDGGIGLVLGSMVPVPDGNRHDSVRGAEDIPRTLTVYLAHKFEQQATGLEVQAALEAMDITVLNPFQRKEQEEYDNVIAHKGGYFSDPQCANIVHADLRLIDRADAVVALLYPNAIGTVMEIFYAGNNRRIPVFTWVTYPMPYRHPWIAYYSKAFTERDPFLAAIKEWRYSDR